MFHINGWHNDWLALCLYTVTGCGGMSNDRGCTATSRHRSDVIFNVLNDVYPKQISKLFYKETIHFIV